jgi:cell division protein FtsB
MDLQTVINLGAGTALAVAGWFARQMWGAVNELRTDLAKLREELPKTYLTRDDFKEGVHELKQLLIAIDTKLDRKVDKG